MLLFLSVQKFGLFGKRPDQNNKQKFFIWLLNVRLVYVHKQKFCALSFWNMRLEAQTFTRSFTWLNLLKQKVWSVAKLFTAARLWETFARYCLRNVMRLESGKRLQQFTRWTSAKETNITSSLQSLSLRPKRKAQSLLYEVQRKVHNWILSFGSGRLRRFVSANFLDRLDNLAVEFERQLCRYNFNSKIQLQCYSRFQRLCAKCLAKKRWSSLFARLVLNN